MLEILDGIIATCAVVLALSLIVQAIQQILKQMLSMKSKYMERELVMMFLPDNALNKFIQECKRFSQKLFPDWSKLKSIDEKNRQIVNELKDKLQSIGYSDLEVLEKINIEQLQTILKGLPMFAGQDSSLPGPLKHALEDVRDWFEITKQAFQDHYERKMKAWAFGISAAVVLALNANLVEIYREFSQSKILRDSAVVWAEKVVSQPRDSVVTIQRQGKPDSVIMKQKSDTVAVAEIKKNIAEIQSLVGMNSFQIMRWDKFQWWGYNGQGWFVDFIRTILGWLSMTLLVSLGAPFWYDFLKAIMGIKNTLKEYRSKA